MCKMGVDDDMMVVIDKNMWVIGVDNFWVVDVFVIFSIISGNLNVVMIMIVEKVVDCILGKLLLLKEYVFVYGVF